MGPFYVYKTNDNIQYQAKQVIEDSNKIFLIESNKLVNDGDIVSLDNNCHDIINNDFYVMVVIDKSTKEITASYGVFSYCHSLYYYKTETNLYINISLHELLNTIKIPLVLDLIGVNEFVKYGFINGNRTLIEQIKKIPSLKTVIFQDKSIESIDSQYTERKSVGDYVDNLCLSLPDKDTKVLVPLSGGYDSTLLTYLIKDYSDKLAVTVGCPYDPNCEFTNAEKTVKYLKVPHEKVYSTDKWIESLPKIVDIMEGEMFDIGIFLCYFLVNRIKELNFTDYTFLAADGADQILNRKFFVDDFNEYPTDNRYISKFFSKYPKQCFYHIVVKKLEWLLRLNDINYTMPFISKEFYNHSKNTTFSRYKEEYKSFVKTYIPAEISASLRKKGGVVDERYFVNNRIYTTFLKILKLPKYSVLFDDSNVNDMNLRNVIYRMYIIFFNYLFIEGMNIDLKFDEMLDIIYNQ